MMSSDLYLHSSQWLFYGKQFQGTKTAGSGTIYMRWLSCVGKEGRDRKLYGSSVNSAIAQRWNGCKRRKPPRLPREQTAAPPTLSGPHCGGWAKTSPRWEEGLRTNPNQQARASLVAQLVKSLLQCGRPGFNPWVGKITRRRERLPSPVFQPGEFHGLYSPWSHIESDWTEWLEM